jgi:hypothetical protein
MSWSGLLCLLPDERSAGASGANSNERRRAIQSVGKPGEPVAGADPWNGLSAVGMRMTTGGSLGSASKWRRIPS